MHLQFTPRPIYEGSRYWPISKAIIARLKQRGSFFVWNGESFFLDKVDKVLCHIDAQDKDLIVLLWRYRVNRFDPLFRYLVSDLGIEAEATVREALEAPTFQVAVQVAS